MLRLFPALALAALAVSLSAGPAAAQSTQFFECADFSPPSVAQACDRAVPIECRGPDAPADFDQCLRDNGTTPEAVDAAINDALRAAGVPVGGVDTGLGGLAREGGGSSGGGDWLPAAAVLLALLAAAGLRRTRASSGARRP